MYEQFAGYELITLLAEGLTGRVYLAQAPGSGQLFAIKEMLLERESALSDDEQRLRFEREVRIHCALDHSNIVKAHAGGVWQDRHYLVLDYQPGTTLHQIMESGRPPILQVIDWGIQLCSALEYLYHQKQLVHRDIKPANLIISPSGQVKMTDFGLARVALHPEITQTKMMLGTIVYMSPEQLLDPTLVDNRADIFAVGAVLFKALTGTLPFAADDIPAMAHRLLYDKPSDPREFNPQIPAELAKVLLRCLAKDVEDRYTSAAALSADLERQLRDPAIHLAQGQIHAEQGEWKAAVHCFQQAATLDSNSAESWFRLGDALEHQGQRAPAFDCFLKVVHLDPAYVAAFRRLGRSYLERGQTEAASRMIERAWTLDPANLETCLDLLGIRRALDRHEEALELATDVIRRHPSSVRAHLEQGRLLYQLGRIDEARGAFESALTHDPREYQALFNLGALAFEVGRLSEAEDFFLKAIALDTSRTEAQHNLALLWYRQSRHPESEEMLRALLAREPNAPSFALLGKVLLAKGKAAEATAAFEHALALSGDWSVRAELAEALALCFRYQEAREVLRIALDQAPFDDRAPLYYLYAHLASTSGDDAGAVTALQACLEHDPSPELASQVRNQLDRLGRISEPESAARTRTPGIFKNLFSGRGLPAAR